MSVFLNNGVGVKVNDVDISDHVSAVSLLNQFDELEVTAMGDTAHKFVAGLSSGTVTLSLFNDNAASAVTSTLNSAIGTTVTVKLLQVKGTAVSATNPLYTFSVLVNKLTPINGSVSELSTQDITFTLNSTVVVSSSGTF